MCGRVGIWMLHALEVGFNIDSYVRCAVSRVKKNVFRLESGSYSEVIRCIAVIRCVLRINLFIMYINEKLGKS